MAFMALALVVTFAAGIGAFHLARLKGRAVGPWVFASAILWFPLLLLALLPARRNNRDAVSSG